MRKEISKVKIQVSYLSVIVPWEQGLGFVCYGVNDNKQQEQVE